MEEDKIYCNECGKEIIKGNNEYGEPNGVGFGLPDGTFYNVCRECLYKDNPPKRTEEQIAHAQDIVLTGYEVKVWGFYLPRVRMDEESLQEVKYACSFEGHIGVNPDPLGFGVFILYRNKTQCKHAYAMCRIAEIEVGEMKSGFIDKGYIDKANEKEQQ